MPPGNKKYVILNGHFYEANKPLFDNNNRAFKFGDALFETMRCHKTRPLFFHDHYSRLLRGMAILQHSIASLPSMTTFSEQIEKLIVRNRLFYDARVRLTVFRRGAGLYTPEDNSVGYLLEATPLENSGYQLNESGLRIGVSSDFPKIWNPLSPFKTLATAPYILGGLCKTKNYWDDCLITNNHERLIEAISSNLFWVRDDKLYTPAISSGCVEGIMRHQIINFAEQQGLIIHETQGALPEELLQAQEIFLTNAVTGVRWVVAFQDKRYYNRLPKKIVRWLNDQLA